MSAEVNANGEIFSSMEIDTIGEIMNISMGSAATAASTLLDNKVTITTPTVKILTFDDFQIKDLEPAIAVEIRYVEGISGSNILILKKQDVRTILSMMMGTEISADFEIDEMAESAICELMNQMMGSSATVLSCFLGRTINISTPETVSIQKLEEFKQVHFNDNQYILTISFELSIKDMMESTFMCAMQIELAREIVNASLNFDTDAGEEEAEPAPAPIPQSAPAAPPAPPPVMPPAPPPQSAAPPPPSPVQQPAAPPPQYQQQYAAPAAYPPPIQQAPPQYYAPYPQGQPAYGMPPPQGMPPQQGYGYTDAPIVVKDYNYGDFNAPGALGREAPTNLDLVMSVPVMVTVELGRTKRKIKEILEFGTGTIVELDKQAGSQVDVIVNGQLIARGDVVVVDDNFSIRITEILKSRDSLSEML